MAVLAVQGGNAVVGLASRRRYPKPVDELPRFRGPLTVNGEEVRNARYQTAISGGVPTTDHRTRAGSHVGRRAIRRVA